MARTMLAWSVVALLALSAGCRMCAHPYDYCGPTFTGECGQACMPNARAGSILSPGMQPAPGPAIGPEIDEIEMGPEMLVPVPDEMAGRVPGVEQPVDGPPQVRPARWAALPVAKVRRR